MKKLACSCVVAAVLAGGSPLALAANALEGSYLGAGGGAARMKFKTDDFASGIPGVQESKDESDNKNYKIYFGARVDKYWALEVGRVSFGKFTHRYETSPSDFLVQEYKVTGWSLSALPTLPLGRFSLFGRIGIFRSSVSSMVSSSSGTLDTALRAVGTPAGETFTKTRKTTVLGAGMQIDFPGSLGLRVEYEDYGEVGDQENTGRARARLASASLFYRF